MSLRIHAATEYVTNRFPRDRGALLDRIALLFVARESHWMTFLDGWDASRRAVELDDIARVLWEHDVSQYPWTAAAGDERELYLGMARAVRNRLLGRAS